MNFKPILMRILSNCLEDIWWWELGGDMLPKLALVLIYNVK